jgi:mono/diheme cytochrome c family protein
MRTAAVTMLSLAIVAVLGGALFIYLGIYNVAATNPHWAATYWVLETARVRSIKMHAADITVPPGLDDQTKIESAVGHFAAHCAECHGAPGAKQGDPAQGMYPRPPDLTNVSKRFTPAEIFWILKNGIKMSGMPSMADDGDDMLWATVGFLEKLPTLSEEDYNDLWMASQARGISHGNTMNMGGVNKPGMDMGQGSDQPKGPSRP